MCGEALKSDKVIKDKNRKSKSYSRISSNHHWVKQNAVSDEEGYDVVVCSRCGIKAKRRMSSYQFDMRQSMNKIESEIPGGKQVVINSEKIEITDHRPYVNWEQRRYELAKSAMQGYCIAFGLNDDSETYENIAIGSLRVANAMIKKMKGG